MSNKYWTDKQNDVDDILAEDFNNAFDMIANDIKKNDVDQTYDPESENAQSGKAVAEALTQKITELYVNPIGYDCYIPELEGSTTIFNMTINNGAIFFLPYNENNTFYQLLIHADVSVNNASINWNTYRFFNGEIPDIGIGKYDFIFEWDGTEWCAGAIAKGVVE